LDKYGFPLYAIEKFKGNQADSNLTSHFGFGLAYATFSGMAIDTSKRLPHPYAYLALCDTITKHSAIIPITVLHQEYFKLDSMALEHSLLYWDAGQIKDVVGRARSPFIADSFFLACPTESLIENNTFGLVFTTDLIFNNSGKTIQNMAVDMGDGNGLQSTNLNVLIHAIYSESGIKRLTIKISYTDGSHFYSFSDINVKYNDTRASETGPYSTSDFTHHISGEIIELPFGVEIEVGGGDIHVSLACGHTKIEKPFIWAEAYNPAIGIIQADLNAEIILERIDHDGARVNDKTLLEYLTENGYDSVILDYDLKADTS
jgi:hypothetical protein